MSPFSHSKKKDVQILCNKDVLDLQMLQPGQVSEGPFFDNPQTVDIPHRSAGTKVEIQRESALITPLRRRLHEHARRSFAHQPSRDERSKAQFCG